uniref:Tenascin XB n=1 Tax=Oncorhynchus kisutch TaxID=8019 RepID=A0A8C7HC13_ONCKI
MHLSVYVRLSIFCFSFSLSNTLNIPVSCPGPEPPSGLVFSEVTETSFSVSWTKPKGPVSVHCAFTSQVARSIPGEPLSATVDSGDSTLALSKLSPGSSYEVSVISVLGLDESDAIKDLVMTRTFTSVIRLTFSFRMNTNLQEVTEQKRKADASQVTPRSALLTWKAPSAAVGSYKLTYQTEGQEIKVTIDSTVTEFKLTRLHPMSKYTVHLQGERGGSYTATISTEFTTGNLRYPFPSDCSQELLNGIHESGEVEIFPRGRQGKPVLVYCDQVTDGGGWTVFQRRMDGKTDFFRGWKNYSKGFGELSGEFWLGNENLHNLTSMAPMTLRVDLRAGDESVFAKYSAFTVDTVRRNYALKVSGYSGTAGDSMSYHNARMFSTRDRDPTPFITRCAMSYRGGWWYKNCHEANLNGLYDTSVNHQGVIWTAWKGKDLSIPFTEMKLRPTSFTPPTQG